MENLNAENLENVLKNIDPVKGEPIAAKYKLVMDAISSGLVDQKSDLAKSSKSYLEGLVSNLIDNSSMSIENPEVNIDILDKELDNVASAFGLKLETIQAKEVMQAFGKVVEIFKELHINFNESDYIAAYVKNAVPLKLDIASLLGYLKTLCEKTANSDFFKSYLYENQDQLLTIIGQFCNGHVMEAFDTLSELREKVDTLYDPKILREKTGIVLPDAQVQELMETLATNQMKEGEIFDAINSVKTVDANSFAKIQFNPSDMVVFLVGLVLDWKGGRTKNVKNGLLIEATASNLDAKKAAELDNYFSKLKKTFAAFNDYREKNPGILTDPYIINAERNIAILRANIAFTKFQQFRVNVQRYLVFSYAEGVEKNDDFEAVVDDIFKRISIAGLRQVAEKYNLQLPPDFAMLEKLDLDYQACKLNTVLKDELNGMSLDDKSLYSEFYRQFADGKLDTSAKKQVALHQIYEESQGLALLSDKNEELLNRDRALVYALIDKYGSIDKVPEAEKLNVTVKLETYFELVKQGQAIGGKLLSTYIEVELLSPNEEVGKNKTPISNEIASIRDFLLELGGSMEDVAQFLGKKDFKAPIESEVADSKLYSLILAKEVRPFNSRFDAVTHKVIDSSNGLGFALANLKKYGDDPAHFEKMAIPPTRLFSHALRAFDNLENGVSNARASILVEQTNLENFKNTVVNDRVDVIKKYPVLKTHFLSLVDNSLAKVNFLLNNEESPIGLKKLDELREAHAALKDAYEKYLTESFNHILVGAIIIAAAVASGMLAASLLVGAASKNLIIVSGTAALGGTVGARLGMGFTNLVRLSDFTKEEILSPRALARDFLLSWGLAIGAFGLARGMMTSLNRGAVSSRVWLSGASRKLLEKINSARGAFSPAEWFGVTEAALGKEAMNKFGIKFVTQYAQAEVENTLLEINPIVGFVASVLNATRGMHVDLEAVRATNAGVEKNAIVYKTATPEEFITQMEAHCSANGAKNFKAEIAPNKTIKFTVEDSAGGITSLEVKPATTGLGPNVSVRRVDGIEHENGSLVIKNGSDLAQCIRQLQEQGFIVGIEGKTMRVQKGASYSEDIKLEFEGNPNAVVKADVLNVAHDLGLKVDPETGDVHVDTAGDFMTLMTSARNKGFNIVRSDDGSYKLQFGEADVNINVRISPNAVAKINALRGDYEALRVEVERANGLEEVPQTLLDRIQMLGLRLLVKLSILLSPTAVYAKDLSMTEKVWNYAKAPFEAFFSALNQASAVLALVCGGYLVKIALYDLAYKLLYKKGSPVFAELFQNKKAIAESVSARKDIAETMAGKKGKKNLDAEFKNIGDSLILELDKFVSYLRKTEYGYFEASGIRKKELDALASKGRDIVGRYKQDPTSVSRDELIDFEAMVKAFANKTENLRNSGVLANDDWKTSKIVRISIASLALLFYLNLKNEFSKAGQGDGSSSDSDNVTIAPPPDIPLTPSIPDSGNGTSASAPALSSDGPQPVPAGSPEAVPNQVSVPDASKTNKRQMEGEKKDSVPSLQKNLDEGQL